MPDLPAAPQCPPWCTIHDPGAGWDVETHGVTKFCQHVIQRDGGTLTLERFADLEQTRVSIDEPRVRIECTERLGMRDALGIAKTLICLVETAATIITAAA